jgi:hypothetical protein
MAAISAEKGAFTVTTMHDGKSVVVRAGETAQVSLSLSTQAAPPAPICGIAATAISAGAWTTAAIIGGSAVLGAGLALSGNEKKLTCQQKQQLVVSPFQFPCP